ncbi:magnesium transporter CorA [Paenibacillus vulneris]|uniref:Magnesium transporter CorA family protein n=1 Tax=Paenibacillus vulneris TaxID=1133364 RepID=A0ABW3UUV9_9BACL
MTIRQLNMPGGWRWHVGDDLAAIKGDEASRDDLHSVNGLQQLKKHSTVRFRTPRIRMYDNGSKALYGAILYGSPAPREDQEALYVSFYLAENELFTSELDYSSMSPHLDEERLHDRMKGCRTAAEGFFVLLSELALVCLHGLDLLSARLTKLEQRMRRFNNAHLLDHLIERQYDLLHWQHRITPLEELLVAVKELYDPEQLARCEAYRLTCLRVERLTLRMAHFNDEVSTLLAMDENIASYRGNEIMKTLTVFTVVCTPATVFAGLWGMNFKEMPELEYQWGYPVSIVFILLLTLIVYGWLKWKGWTGDLIRGKKKDSNLF